MERNDHTARELIENYARERAERTRRRLFAETCAILGGQSIADGVLLTADLLSHTAYYWSPEEGETNQQWAYELQDPLTEWLRERGANFPQMLLAFSCYLFACAAVLRWKTVPEDPDLRDESSTPQQGEEQAGAEQGEPQQGEPQQGEQQGELEGGPQT